ncbi:hypothetical protein BRC77_12430 [Halobacteriales archaeon QH_8_64_26]|nr:MAG: hypothetical protein BRC77_12430 [Halobacteriales archaeon QH_8_64_26]
MVRFNLPAGIETGNVLFPVKSPRRARLPRLAARFAPSFHSVATVLASPGFAERSAPFSPTRDGCSVGNCVSQHRSFGSLAPNRSPSDGSAIRQAFASALARS